jgi:putative transposon-encoded protein
MLYKRKKFVEGTFIKAGNSGGVLVPKEWIGKIAKVQIIEEEVKDE